MTSHAQTLATHPRIHVTSFATPFRPARLFVAGLGLTLAASLAGCSSEASEEPGATAASTADGFPMTITNCGRTSTIEEPPQRVVSLNQGSTEILLSLGLEDRMVGTATWTDPVLESLAEANESVPRLADQAPSKERLLDAAPDFVTASFSNTFGTGGVITPDELTKLGVGSYLSPAECLKNNEGDGDGERDGVLEIDAIFQEITELAAIFGVPERGEALVADLEQRMDRAEENAAAAEVSALFWFANAESPTSPAAAVARASSAAPWASRTSSTTPARSGPRSTGRPSSTATLTSWCSVTSPARARPPRRAPRRSSS